MIIKIQLTYDAAKDKYYLDIFAYRQSNTETFYGEYALEEYLRNDLCFDSEQINKLYSKCTKLFIIKGDEMIVKFEFDTGSDDFNDAELQGTLSSFWIWLNVCTK